VILKSNANQTTTWQISDHIALGGHCYIYEFGITSGHAYPLKEDYNRGLEWAYHCVHGGSNNVHFVGTDGDILAKGWVRADPQWASDCS
jgi:hypothetical protein